MRNVFEFKQKSQRKNTKLFAFERYRMIIITNRGYSYANKLKRSAEGKGVHMKPMPDGDFRLNEMITEDMVADEYDRKTSCQLRFQQTSVEVNTVYIY